jgi:hypothetical protein
MFRLKNGGVSPALGATAIANLFIRPLDEAKTDANRKFILDTCTHERDLIPMEKVLGILILPREARVYSPVDAATLPRDIFPNPDGSVSAWIVACVDYRDQFDKLHGIGGINTFVTTDGHRTFKPEGTVNGLLQQAFFQVLY